MSDNFTSSPFNRAFAAALRANVPTLMWGAPGIGKTATIEAWGKAWGYHVESVVGSNREPSDFMGLPIEVNGQTKYAELDWARRLIDADKGLLFLGEMTTSSPSVQRTQLRILQERVVGDTPLPDSVAIIADANPPEIAVDGWDLAAPVANRMMHLDWHFDSDAWMDGFMTDFQHVDVPSFDSLLNDGDVKHAIRAKSLVAAFLKNAPQFRLAVPTDPTAGGRGWCSPRSWTNCAAVLAQLQPGDESATMLVVTGCVGEGAANEFMAWLVSSDLYDPEAVIADPSIVNWSERPDRVFALTMGVVAIAKMRGDKKTWESVMKVMVACAEAHREDLAYPGTRALMQSMPEGAVVPKAAIAAFETLFTKTGKWKAA
jgi:hypothetical protein